jgi:hypothetical protein
MTEAASDAIVMYTGLVSFDMIRMRNGWMSALVGGSLFSSIPMTEIVNLRSGKDMICLDPRATSQTFVIILSAASHWLLQRC